MHDIIDSVIGEDRASAERLVEHPERMNKLLDQQGDDKA